MGCTNTKKKYIADSDSQSDVDVYTKNKAPFDVKPPRELGDSNNFLTEKQKILVRETWNLIKEDKIEKGSKIFIRIFEKRPEIKQLFPFRNLSDEEVMLNPLFRSHGLRFMMAVQSTVENLDALNLFLVPNLIQLGKKHLYVTDNFTLYEKIFRQSIIEIFEEELGKITFSFEIKESWTLLFNFITEKLMEGYCMEEEEQRSKRDNGGPPLQPRTGYYPAVSDDVIDTADVSCPIASAGDSASSDESLPPSTRDDDTERIVYAEQSGCVVDMRPPGGVKANQPALILPIIKLNGV